MFNLKKTTVAVAAALAAAPMFAAAASATLPYLNPVAPGVSFASILTVGEAADNGYRMAGIPDGLGAYDNDDGTITVLMNHELGNGVGVPRAHNPGVATGGAFVSEWVINKNTLQVVSGRDLIQTVYGWDTATQTSAAAPLANVVFNRFCSADLPLRGAFYNNKSRLGSKARSFMNGEEGGSNGYAMAHVASGPDKGKSYILGNFNLSTNGSGINAVGGWENLLANPNSGDKTVVIGTNDGGTGIMSNSIAVYVGAKTGSGSEVDKAGLTNGSIKFVNVDGIAKEITNSATRATGIASGMSFTLSASSSTTFSRPEDGAWADGKTFYFVTTDQIDKTELTGGTQVGATRLWKLNFNDDYTGGTIDMVVDAASISGGLNNARPNMFDNMTVNADGTLTLLEDAGNNEHNGKVWQYAPIDGSLTLQAKFDPALFGDVVDGTFTAGTVTKDEETSGVIDVTRLLDRHDDNRYSLLVVQNHKASSDAELVEGGQLLLMSRPEFEIEDEDEHKK
ncbi:MAG: hypothetical protein FIA97_08995 [Methylococcaceae bacterium]|nr:hypothetical protein [Methylococcaceae bacterium]